MSESTITRRSVLRSAVAGIAAAGLGGIASADDPIEVNVGFDGSAGKQVAVDTATDVVREFDSIDAVTIRAPREAIQGLVNNPTVRYVEKNGRMGAFDQETPWGIEQVRADVAIDEGYTGDGVSVAIIDTGIDPHHETLEENLGEGWATTDAVCQDDCEADPFFCPGANEIDTCYEEWDDDHDHGTHVAGTAGAADNDLGVLGVAPDATLHAVKVLDCCGGGTFSDVAAGIEWSAQQGHEVQNMSLGGDASNVVEDAVEYAANQGVVIVAAAGNDGPDEDSVAYPAAYDEVIAVSATDQNDDIAEFSSRGPEVDLAAPGVDVLSSVARDDYAEFSGTSMASPHVAGGAAQVIADGLTDREEVRQRLKDTADDIGLDDTEQGAGRLNVAAALGIDDDDDDPDEAPIIEQFDVTRRTTGPWSRADVDWEVSDPDGSLDTVVTELLDAAGSVLDSESSNVSGGSAAGEHKLRTRDSPDAVRLTVTDEADNSTSETKDY